ncbi:MAG: hypothetical protein LBQ81_08245 [Zoogloeaceae bacterium]|jgi:hypothetical protein|nr:hypothetical protein [Zoogloeaceae bacterium]
MNMNDPHIPVSIALQYEAALEKISELEEERQALDDLCLEQHKALAACADALHKAKLAIDGYCVSKDAAFKKINRKKRPFIGFGPPIARAVDAEKYTCYG